MKELIVAIDLNNAIGYNNQLLCHLPNDLKHFKKMTLGKNVYMGRKTWDSLPIKPLPERENVVFSRDGEFMKDFSKRFCTVIHTSPLCNFFKNSKEDFIVIGGSQIYKAAIDYVNVLYVTEIQHIFENADAYFPKIDLTQWKEVERIINKADDKHEYDYHFIKYEKITKEELIIEYICSWEHWMGESWMDYYGDDYIYLNISFLLGYWSVKFPDLYKHLMEISNYKIPWKYPQDFGPDDNGLDDLVEDFYYPNRYSDDKGTVIYWDEEKYKKSLIPWVSIIIDNPIYFRRFIDRSIDDFENYDKTDSSEEKIRLYNLLIRIKEYDWNL